MSKAAELVTELAAKAAPGMAPEGRAKVDAIGGNSGESTVFTDKACGVLGSRRGAHAAPVHILTRISASDLS